jgi:hypothetical protein
MFRYCFVLLIDTAGGDRPDNHCVIGHSGPQNTRRQYVLQEPGSYYENNIIMVAPGIVQAAATGRMYSSSCKVLTALREKRAENDRSL